MFGGHEAGRQLGKRVTKTTSTSGRLDLVRTAGQFGTDRRWAVEDCRHLSGRLGPHSGRDLPLACGLIGGALVDAIVGDPTRCHPVALFGQVMTTLEERIYADGPSA